MVSFNCLLRYKAGTWIQETCALISQLSITKNPQQSSLISLKIQIQTQIQQKTNCEEKRTEKHPRNAWFYSKKKSTCQITIHGRPAIVHRCQKSKTKIQPHDQSSRISKPCCTPTQPYAAEYYAWLENKLHRATTPHSCYLK